MIRTAAQTTGGRPPAIVRRRRTKVLLALLAAVLLPALALGAVLAAYARDVRSAEAFYAAPGEPRVDGQRVALAPVRSLRVLPLVEWYAARDDLETENGLSYLVQADDTTILFDLGFNRAGSAEPPLLRNMARLGVDPAEVDVVVASHPHNDHLGGGGGANGDRAIVREDADPLAGKPLYSTVPLAVSGGTSTVVDAPRALTPAVGTTGPVPVGLFLVGYTLEQALVIDLEGKGLVLVVGCGHPGVEAIVRRAEQVHERPVYAVIGGLHFPVTEDHAQIGPLRGQNLFGSPTPPWRPIAADDVHGAIAFLRERGVAVVGVSPHDSCDWSLAAFASAFGAGYRPVRVGEPIDL